MMLHRQAEGNVSAGLGTGSSMPWGSRTDIKCIVATFCYPTWRKLSYIELESVKMRFHGHKGILFLSFGSALRRTTSFCKTLPYQCNQEQCKIKFKLITFVRFDYNRQEYKGREHNRKRTDLNELILNTQRFVNASNNWSCTTARTIRGRKSHLCL